MKFFKKMKDGGDESTVTGYWAVEIKGLFSIVLLNFKGKSREAFHNHAFNAISWVIKGSLIERISSLTEINQEKRVNRVNYYKPSLKPIVTGRDVFHKVSSDGSTWALSFRGPWKDEWVDYDEKSKTQNILTHGRQVVASLAPYNEKD